MKAVIGFVGEITGYWIWLLGFFGILAFILLLPIPGSAEVTGIRAVKVEEVMVIILAIGGLWGLAYGIISFIKSILGEGGEKE